MKIRPTDIRRYNVSGKWRIGEMTFRKNDVARFDTIKEILLKECKTQIALLGNNQKFGMHNFRCLMVIIKLLKKLLN